MFMLVLTGKALGQEVALLSRLRHLNIVQYFGSEIVMNFGGSIYKLLQEYGQFGESVIRSYTQQILSGLAYLHAKNTVHRLLGSHVHYPSREALIGWHLRLYRTQMVATLLLTYGVLDALFWKWLQQNHPGASMKGREDGEAAGVYTAPVRENPNYPTTIVVPFNAPPSFPASFLQSDPPSATQSPAGLLSLTSLSVNAYSPGGPASIFAIGPYAYETHGTNDKIILSPYEFQPYQLYPGSPVGQLISPGSAISNSGTSSPFPDKCPIIEFRQGEAPKRLGYNHFYARKWGSRLGSGSLTPNGGEPASRDSFLQENQISEVASLANSENGSQNDEIVIDHRVSFELTSEDVPTCLEKDPVPSLEFVSESLQDRAAEGTTGRDALSKKTDSYCKCCVGAASNEMNRKASGEGEGEQCHQKHRSLTLGSIKEFNFDNTKGEISDKPPTGSEWWANGKEVGKELGPQNNWTFFPILRPGVS
ncbi:hypothetical protein F0562_031220 [Nyssa sinensis]|uniref:Protein kinase domain-containing protein n=1 Tax=Nyssa sinensis TaxID=561372 RepID=A0A5J5ARS9_9ASTE|nr:hypothetical protein F0562_031220 [Nyssa sinensis]